MDIQYINSLKSLEKRNMKQHYMIENMVERSKIFNLSHWIKNLRYSLIYRKRDKRYYHTIERKVLVNQNDILWEESLTKNLHGEKMVVYTCIIDSYDNPIEPSFLHKDIDYILYTNTEIKSEVWEVRRIPEKLNELGNATLINRYIKLHPFEFFQEYEYTLYIDGNIEVASDVTGLINQLDEYGIGMHKHFERKSIYSEAQSLIILKKGKKEKILEQINKYRKSGFPNDYGLAEATIILSNSNSKLARKIFELWWEEFLNSSSMRDQLSFPYVMWKNSFDINKVTTLGDNLRLSGKFYMHQHR